MAGIEDGDRFFSGRMRASMPKHLIEEGSVARLLNARFIEGAITNGYGFTQVPIKIDENVYVPEGNVDYKTLLSLGNVQLVAPMVNTRGKFLIFIISGRVFELSLYDYIVRDITPKNNYIPIESNTPLSYLDNDGDVLGAGGYLVIFNYPNRPLFIDNDGARFSKANDFEMPSSRLGATAGNRAFVISGDNLMYASDPLGGASSLAPLTFEETLDPAGAYTGQVFTIGSSINMAYVTAMARMPRLFASGSDFLAQSLLVSTKYKKFIISAGTPRDDWETSQFIVYAGSGEGIAGSLAVTLIGSVPVYISTTGRIKTFGEDETRENTLTESYFDEDLGQYTCCYDPDFYHRIWYRDLDHSRSVIKFVEDKLYVTVFPQQTHAINKYNDVSPVIHHKALAIGSLSSDSMVGSTAQITWEGFIDWFDPVTIVNLDHTLYVWAKNEYGVNALYKRDDRLIDDHTTTIVTRGYFNQYNTRSKSLTEISLYFRKLWGTVKVSVSYLNDGKWLCGGECISNKKQMLIKLHRNKCRTNASSISLKIDIEHNGCKFELATIRVKGESYFEEA